MSYWIKSVYNTDARWSADEWQGLTWISDHHRFRKNGEPSHRPGYRVGDELVVYDATNRACPARLRVTAEADYQPGRVSREAGRGEGRRWGWLTEVELLAAVDRDRAPTLLEIYVQPKSMRQQDHMTMRGTLKAGTDIAVEDPWPRVEGGEALYFFTEDSGSGFFVHADGFRQAEWTGSEGDLLVVVTGGLVFRFGVGD